MKVAVDSIDSKEIDLHFSDAKTLLFDLDFDNLEFEEVRTKRDIPVHEHGERWRDSIDLIHDCKVVLCLNIDQKPHIELRKLGIK